MDLASLKYDVSELTGSISVAGRVFSIGEIWKDLTEYIISSRFPDHLVSIISRGEINEHGITLQPSVSHNVV